MAKKPPSPPFDPRVMLEQIASDDGQATIHRIRAVRALMLAAEPKPRGRAQPADLVSAMNAARSERPGAMPLAEVYRATGVHRFQSRHRIETIVRPAIDRVLAESDPKILLMIAGDVTQPPESRLAARDRYVALCQERTMAHEVRVGDVTAVEAMVAGLGALRWADPDRYCSLLCTGAEPERRPAELVAEMVAAQA